MKTAPDYLDHLQRLLPRGAAWSRDLFTVLSRVLEAAAESLARVEARAADLLNEADPRTTVELLPEWEAAYGLPDPCAGEEQTLDGRRRRLVAKKTQLGGQSRAYYIAVAAALGYAITITEYTGGVDCNGFCDDFIAGGEWRFVWTVNAPETTVEHATCNGFCDEPLASWGNDVLECAIARLKPAHTQVLFAYGA